MWVVLEFIIRKQTGTLILKVLIVDTLSELIMDFIEGGTNFVCGRALTKENFVTFSGRSGRDVCPASR